MSHRSHNGSRYLLPNPRLLEVQHCYTLEKENNELRSQLKYQKKLVSEAQQTVQQIEQQAQQVIMQAALFAAQQATQLAEQQQAIQQYAIQQYEMQQQGIQQQGMQFQYVMPYNDSVVYVNEVNGVTYYYNTDDQRTEQFADQYVEQCAKQCAEQPAIQYKELCDANTQTDVKICLDFAMQTCDKIYLDSTVQTYSNNQTDACIQTEELQKILCEELLPHNAILRDAISCDAVPRNAMPHNAISCNAMPRNALSRSTTIYNNLNDEDDVISEDENATPQITTIKFPKYILERHLLPTCSKCTELYEQFNNTKCPKCPLIVSPFSLQPERLCNVTFNLYKYENCDTTMARLLARQPKLTDHIGCEFKQNLYKKLMNNHNHCHGHDNYSFCSCQCNVLMFDTMIRRYVRNTFIDKDRNYCLDGMFVLKKGIHKSYYRKLVPNIA